MKTTEIPLPELDTTMVHDAMKFHDELDQAASVGCSGFDIHPIAGTRQATFTTARLSGGSIEPIETIGGENEGGDATVPRFAAIPKSVRPDSPIIRHMADQHGSLQSNRAVFDEIEGILTAKPVIYRAAPRIQIGVKTEPLVLSGEKIEIEASVAGGERVALQAEVMNEDGKSLIRGQKLSCLSGVQKAMQSATQAPSATSWLPKLSLRGKNWRRWNTARSA